MKPGDDNDRRQHPRADGPLVSAVVLARHNAGALLSLDSLSAGGACLVGALALDVGEHIQILFELHGRPIEVHAQVIRVDCIDMLTDRIGVEFRDMTDQTRELIRAYVTELLELDEH